jgi:hypothetical protein
MCGAVKVWRPEFDKEPRAKAVILVGTRGRESMNSRSVLLKTGCIVLLTCAQLAIAQNGCEALKGLKLDHAAIVSAKWAEAGPVQVPAGFPPKIESIPANKHCEITAVSRPTSDSEITFTLWLPAQEAWNGKYLQLGNGGWAGSIQVRGLIEPMGRAGLRAILRSRLTSAIALCMRPPFCPRRSCRRTTQKPRRAPTSRDARMADAKP